MYGAGTGGVLLMQSQNTSDMHSVGFKAGADGLLGLNAALHLKNQRIQFEHLQYDGYRNHTEMKRNSATWIGNWKTGVHSHTQAMMLYTDLFYETPGALTLAEFQTNPRGARPASPVFPGAEN